MGDPVAGCPRGVVRFPSPTIPARRGSQAAIRVALGVGPVLEIPVRLGAGVPFHVKQARSGAVSASRKTEFAGGIGTRPILRGPPWLHPQPRDPGRRRAVSRETVTGRAGRTGLRPISAASQLTPSPFHVKRK